MGGNSTSQGAVLGNDTANKKHNYDLLSWQGVAEMLKDGRNHIKDPLAYAEFRDLVLAYSRSGGDKELKTKLDAIVASFGKQPPAQKKDADKPEIQETKEKVEVEKKLEVQVEAPKEDKPLPQEKKQTTPTVGRTRVTPSFMPKIVSTPETKVAQEKPVEPVRVPEPEPTPVTLEDSVPQEEPETVETKKEPEPRPESAQVSETKEASKSTSGQHNGVVSVDEHRKRITEIKREVNEKIGNPAALVDTHNEVGKEYMTALLTALKALTPGGPIGIDKAMEDLEAVFKRLLEVDTFGDTKEKGNTVEVVPEVSTPQELASNDLSDSDEVAPNSDVTESSEPEKSETQVHVPETNVPRNIPLAKDPLPTQEELSTPRPVPPAPPIPSPPKVEEEKQVESVASMEGPQDSAEVEQTPVSSQSPMPVKETEVVAEPVSLMPKRTPGGVIASLVKEDAEDVADKDISTSESSDKTENPTPGTALPVNNLPTETSHQASEDSHVPPAPVPKAPENTEAKNFAAQSLESTTPIPGSVKTTVQQSELVSPEINKALHDLLDEWPLFAGSGLFGIGPGGMEHPLYRKLSMLAMGEVLAGRWDKADPKVIKTIKEYVNAWRHEQGIAYTINETFEHYLRRVVQRILKRQNS